MNKDELVEKIMQYSSNYDWYELVDIYGNIVIDEESRNSYKESIYKTLEQQPDTIINYLKDNLEEIGDKKSEIYRDTQNLINEVKSYMLDRFFYEDMEM